MVSVKDFLLLCGACGVFLIFSLFVILASIWLIEEIIKEFQILKQKIKSKDN